MVLYNNNYTVPSNSSTFGQWANFPTRGGGRGQAGLPFIHNVLDSLNVNKDFWNNLLSRIDMTHPEAQSTIDLPLGQYPPNPNEIPAFAAHLFMIMMTLSYGEAMLASLLINSAKNGSYT
jgi:hypothetical protein